MPLQPRRGGYYPPATPTTKTWEYNDSTWSDLLTNFNGESITYDEIGNPLTIGEKSLTWTGRQLQSITDGDTEIAYTYNGDGLRTSKTINGETTNYYYNGSILAGQKSGEDTLVFMYDNNSDIFGFIYNNTEYYYIKNAQNDVIDIADADGNVLIKYAYDAWGKVIAVTDKDGNEITESTDEPTNPSNDIDESVGEGLHALPQTNEDSVGADAHIDPQNTDDTTVGNGVLDVPSTANEPTTADESVSSTTVDPQIAQIARINPILYRSYYYDKETEWYYLTSRFYNPEFCRFINSDTYSLPTATPTELTDKNLFAYCDNNPITRADSDGDFWHIVIGAAVGAAIAGTTTALSGGSGKEVLISAISGALSGGLASTGLGPVASFAANMAISAAESFTTQAINNGVKNVNYGEVAVDAVIGGALSISGDNGVTKHLQKSGKQTVKRTVNKFTHKGFKAGITEFKKATKYYIKNNRKYYTKYLKDLKKDVFVSVVSIIRNRFKK